MHLIKAYRVSIKIDFYIPFLPVLRLYFYSAIWASSNSYRWQEHSHHHLMHYTTYLSITEGKNGFSCTVLFCSTRSIRFHSYHFCLFFLQFNGVVAHSSEFNQLESSAHCIHHGFMWNSNSFSIPFMMMILLLLLMMKLQAILQHSLDIQRTNIREDTCVMYIILAYWMHLLLIIK